jgi:hypothetical protein
MPGQAYKKRSSQKVALDLQRTLMYLAGFAVKMIPEMSPGSMKLLPDPFPREPEKGEKGQIERVLLVNVAEIIPKIAESEKKTNPFALISHSIFIQNRFNIHGALLCSE